MELLQQEVNIPNEWQQLFLVENDRFTYYYIDFVEANNTDHALLDQDRENIWHALELARRKNNVPQFVRGAVAVSNYMNARNHIQQGEHYLRQAVQAAETANDTSLLALALKELGVWKVRRGAFDVAESLLHQSLDLIDQTQPDATLQGVYQTLGLLLFYRGDYEEAESYWLKSIKIAEQLGAWWQVASINGNLGLRALNQAQYEKALVYFQEARRVAEKIDAFRLQIAAMVNIGIINKNTGDFSQAESIWLKALEMAKEADYTDIVGYTLGNLAELSYTVKNFQEAKQFAHESLEIGTEIEHATIAGAAACTLAQATFALQEFAETERYLHRSEQAISGGGDSVILLQVYNQWGELHLHNRALASAEEAFNRALAQARQIKAQESEAIALLGLSKVADARGDSVMACRLGRESLAIVTRINHHMATEIEMWVKDTLEC